MTRSASVFEPGVPVHEQVTFAAKKAVMSGQMHPGNPFPSVRTLSRSLKINPNTAHKVILQLTAEGLLEVKPGIGTVIAHPPSGSRMERTRLMGRELEQVVVEAKKLGLALDELQAAVARHWRKVGIRRGGFVMAEAAIVRFRNLSKRFAAKAALDGVSFEVPEGSVFSILGPNGAGKSTALRLLMNLERPTSGSSDVMGCDSRRLGALHMQSLGYLSESQRVPEWMRVGEFLAYCRAFYSNWHDEDASELTDRLQLPLEQRLNALSRGTRAKVALASVLSYRPRLVLLDEPFGSLDVLVREQVAESILDRVPETTVVLATHDLLDIESFATHIAYIDLGRLVFVEELGSLLARFREVVLTFDESVPQPTTLPAGWINLEQSGRVLRFVDTCYHLEASASRIRSTFEGIRHADVRPMALRAIFVALAGSQARTNP